ncbi:MAG: hypothetical protein KBF37_03485 [Saprospiraceae bacterium]|jgi:hypothetical protein|nr:hypothetical protein [Saprospiraceae bacterium]MBP9209364.1 hypothetical protein [Saprospiraceae bacterium]MBV6474228.1 hypothetical protein [Saprospiraceae bacterium]MCC6753703.1 hypothetical protein [Saprospiraceae bacterium]
MSKFHLFVFFAFSGMMVACAPSVYKSPDFDKLTSRHKLVAILPFNVQIDSRNLPKNVTAEMVREDEKKTSYSIQGHAYGYLLQELSKKKFTVRFQDIDKTNALLREKGVEYGTIRDKTREDLCRLLDVDAVLSGKVNLSRPMSEGGAVAIGLLFGVWGTTNEVSANLVLHEHSRGELLWKYDWQAEGSVGSSAEKLSRSLMRSASKNFPYQKKK